MESNVLALIPAFNEGEHITLVVKGAARHLPVLVVDDGSSDGTGALAQAAGGTVVRHPINQGKGSALRTGFDWALEQGYQAVLTLDGDGQHDPAEIPKFLDAYAGDAGDLIIGFRDFRQIPPVRRIANTVGRVTLSWALGRPILDNQSGYRLVPRSVIEALSGRLNGFEFEVEMIARTIWAGLKLAWIPIRTIYANEHSHIEPLGHTARYFRLVWLLWREKRLRQERCLFFETLRTRRPLR